MNWKLPAVPTEKAAEGVLVMVGAWLTWMLTILVPGEPIPLLASMVTWVIPTPLTPVAVPLSTPVAESSCRPAGSVPELTL